MSKLIVAVLLLAATSSFAGVLRTSYKVTRFSVKHAAHGAKKAGKVAYKVAY